MVVFRCQNLVSQLPWQLLAKALGIGVPAEEWTEFPWQGGTGTGLEPETRTAIAPQTDRRTGAAATLFEASLSALTWISCWKMDH